MHGFSVPVRLAIDAVVVLEVGEGQGKRKPRGTGIVCAGPGPICLASQSRPQSRVDLLRDLLLHARHHVRVRVERG